MEPQALIDTAVSSGVPAPFWFVQFFKVLGFTLHMVPMNLWYAGTLLAVSLHLFGSEHGRRFGHRLLNQMPIWIAFGINFGIVPLLFLQLAYAKVFYPATILMAWFWFSIFGLLIPAYYGVYVYAFGLRQEGTSLAGWKRAVGWIAAVLFIAIGFIFANGLSLTTNVRAWPELWTQHSVGGAATGTGLNVADPTLWPRWLLMFGLALMTTAAWTVVDAAWLAAKETAEYRRWAAAWAAKLVTVGLIVVVGAGAWYAFGTWRSEVRDVMFALPGVFLFAITAASPGLVWLLIVYNRNQEVGRAAATLVGLAQVGVLALNAIGRQVAQNVELKPFLDVANQPTATQWGPMVLFLVSFVIGVLVIAWMVAQIFTARRPDAEDASPIDSVVRTDEQAI